MLNKKFILLCALILSAALICGCTPQQQPTEKLVVGYYDYEPYTYIDENGDPAGMDVELATEACRRIGYQAVFRKISSNDTYSLLHDKSVDCVWSCFAMDGNGMLVASGQSISGEIDRYEITQQLSSAQKDECLHTVKANGVLYYGSGKTIKKIKVAKWDVIRSTIDNHSLVPNV